MTSSVRVLAEADLDDFWQIRLRALKEHPESFGASLTEPEQMTRSEILQRLTATADSFVLGVFNPDLVGIAGFFRRSGLKLKHKGTIWGVYVTPDSRGQKLGKLLIESCIDRAKAMPDMEHIMLTVVTANGAARELYKSLGFVSFGIEPAALKCNGQDYDEEMMQYTINK